MKLKTLTLLANTENHIPLPCAVGGLAYVSGPTVLTVKTTDNDAYPPLSPNGVIYFDRVYGNRGSQDPSLILLGSGIFTLIFLKPGEKWEFPTQSILNPDTGLFRCIYDATHDNGFLLYNAPAGQGFDPNNPPNVPFVKLEIYALTGVGYLQISVLSFADQYYVPRVYDDNYAVVPNGQITMNGRYWVETIGCHCVNTDSSGLATCAASLVYCKGAAWPVR
jgi:hypothetical protein